MDSFWRTPVSVHHTASSQTRGFQSHKHASHTFGATATSASKQSSSSSADESNGKKNRKKKKALQKDDGSDSDFDLRIFANTAEKEDIFNT